jgi:hypothetical protein
MPNDEDLAPSWLSSTDAELTKWGNFSELRTTSILGNNCQNQELFARSIRTA